MEDEVQSTAEIWMGGLQHIKPSLVARNCSPPVQTRLSSASQVSNRNHRGFPYLWVPKLRFTWHTQVSEVPYLHTGLLGSVMISAEEARGFDCLTAYPTAASRHAVCKHPATGACYVRRSIVVFRYAVRHMIPLEMAPSIGPRQCVN